MANRQFSQYLLNRGILSSDNAGRVLAKSLHVVPDLAVLALEKGLITSQQAKKLLGVKEFVVAALEESYLNALQLDELKKAVGWAALQYVQPGTIVGVGTGSTAAHFIDALGTMKGQIEGAVSSSDASTEKLKSLGIHVFDLNEVDSLGIYVDGADEINGHMQMIKGGGAALTREKIIASVAEKFICIADASKQVDILGKFPLPVEVIPMARSAVARQLVKLGGRPEYRQGVVTDNGNVILDVHGMEILDPIAMENAINAIPGVVTVGLFANRGADVALIGTPDGVKTIVK